MVDVNDARTAGRADEQDGAPDGGATGRSSGVATWWRRPPKDFEHEVEYLKAPDGNALIPWLLMVFGPAADILGGRAAPPWLAWAGLLAFCVLYVATIRSAFSPRLSQGPVPYRLLGGLAAVTSRWPSATATTSCCCSCWCRCAWAVWLPAAATSG